MSYLTIVIVLTSLLYVPWTTGEQCPGNLPHTTIVTFFNEKCYQFVNKEKYWTSARDYCWKYGGKLVTVDNAETQEFISDKLNSLSWGSRGVWIGLHDSKKEERYEWVATHAADNGIPLSWHNWASGHPGAILHSLRDCVRMVRKSNWQWHETPCKVLRWKYNFICEYASTQTSSERQLGTGSKSTDTFSESSPIGGAMAAGSQQDKNTQSTVSAGLVTGLVVFAVVVIVSVLFLLIRRRQQKRSEKEGIDSFSNQIYAKDDDDDKPIETKVTCGNGQTAVAPVRSANQYISTPRELPDIPSDDTYLEASVQNSSLTQSGSEYLPMDRSVQKTLDNNVTNENIYSEINEARNNHYANI